MAQYIDKNALVAKIQKQLKFQQTCIETGYRLTGKAEEEIILEYNQLLSFINTLEVKDPWKPTDEQMRALQWSLGDYRNAIFEGRHDILTSLYNDLKKMKEE